MKTESHQNQDIVENLRLLGDYWTLRIIDALQNGELRYCPLQRALDNLNPVTLTDRLKTLEEAGLVTRTEDAENSVAVLYDLSDLGRQALPVVKAIKQFAQKTRPAS